MPKNSNSQKKEIPADELPAGENGKPGGSQQRSKIEELKTNGEILDFYLNTITKILRWVLGILVMLLTILFVASAVGYNIGLYDPTNEHARTVLGGVPVNIIVVLATLFVSSNKEVVSGLLRSLISMNVEDQATDY
ncbi:MAG: hypothetical protein OXO50_01615 [Caldilineaceae bacterium]|nr:hypothetical protein [Caldilineaceae bacterium]